MRTNRPSTFTRRSIRLSILGLLLGAIFPASPDPAIAGDRPTKLERQIGVMEKAINTMLVDSPNFLVSGSDVTEGFEDDEYGALFVFSASLTGPGWDGHGLGAFFSGLPHGLGKEGKVIIRKIKGKGGETEIDIDDEGVYIDGEDVIVLGKGDKKWKKLLKEKGGDFEVMDDKELKERQLKKYESAKQELIEVLMDYGEILKGLPAGRSVKIMARMRNMDLPEGKEVRKLTVRATIDDLRSYGDGRLSEEQMRSRIEIKES